MGQRQYLTSLGQQVRHRPVVHNFREAVFQVWVEEVMVVDQDEGEESLLAQLYSFEFGERLIEHSRNLSTLSKSIIRM